ncbi:MAG: TyeA family type III secretion system gatekeeper subunit [Planctomycetes bacterium]|nr:TyeA family type III secretion system gatekeeper subunit [Planctomycetota bacterium]
MSSHITGSHAPGAAGYSPADSQGVEAAAQGEWNGLTVLVDADPASLIADAAEELTFSASETVEKKVSERKKTAKDRPVTAVRPPEEVLEKMRRRNEEKLARLLAAVRAGGNPAAFHQAMDAFSVDPSERHAAMLWLEDSLADAPSLAAMVRRERERYENEEAAAIQAGYNIDGVEDTAATGGTGKELYRRTILGHAGIGEMIAAILDREGGEDFLAAVDYLRRAVGADLSAATPSIDTRELETLNNDLYHLRAIATFTREFDGEMEKIRTRAALPPLDRAGRETLSLLCRMKEERLVRLDGLKTILSLQGKQNATYDVLCLSQCHRLAHRLPGKLFTDEDSRQRLLAACQKILDAAIDLEEALAGDN